MQRFAELEVGSGPARNIFEFMQFLLKNVMMDESFQNRGQFGEICLNINIQGKSRASVAEIKEQFCIAAVTVSQVGAETVSCQEGILNHDRSAGPGEIQLSPRDMDVSFQDISLNDHAVKIPEIS